jgi:hypothetical protein
MASMNLADHVSGFAVIRADGEGILISFPLGNQWWNCCRHSYSLKSAVPIEHGFLHIDDEVYDSLTGELSHTIGQLPVCNGDGKHWLLGPTRFRLYSLSESVMATTTILATPLSLPSCTIQSEGWTRSIVRYNTQWWLRYEFPSTGHAMKGPLTN